MRRRSAAVALALVAIGLTTPAPVLADNGASLQDLWSIFDLAVFAGLATPVLLWLADAARIPDPPLLVPLPPETFPTDYSNYVSDSLPDNIGDEPDRPLKQADPPKSPPHERDPDGLDELGVQY